MEQKLTKKEKQTLIQQHRLIREGKIRDRIKAVLAYDDGYSYSEIGRLLLLDDETIRRHVQDYWDEKKLAPSNGGSDSHLSVLSSQELIAHLSEKTYRYVKDICHYVKRQYGVRYTISGMTKWLQANNFRYKKPQGVPAKADKSKQIEFIEYYKQLKKKSKNEPIYFMDSVHPEHQTRLVCGWILKGQQKGIAKTGRQHRLNFMGGICLDNHKIVYEQATKIDEYSIQSFFYRLRKEHPGRYNVHVILDNAGYHCSHDVQKFAEELGIKLHYLPPYSPNLNPIERLWKIMHEHVTDNRYYETFSDFTEAINYFFRHIGKKKILLRSRITDNFQVLSPLNFAS
jgi:transposase